MVHGRFDPHSPVDAPGRLSPESPGRGLVVVDAGHGAGQPGMTDTVASAPAVPTGVQTLLAIG